jgi:uncharacterized protein YndB with AHSA1/START domain
LPTFEATTSVAAPPAAVWTSLLATDRWTSWDQQLESVDGRLADGGRLEIRVKDNARPFRLKVATWEPQRRIVLTGGMPLGLFTGTRTYTLADDGDGGSTTVTVRETYTGPLAGLIGKSIPDLQPSFDSFVFGLRRDAEGQDQHR